MLTWLMAQSNPADTSWLGPVFILGIPLAFGLASEALFEFIRRRRRPGSPVGVEEEVSVEAPAEPDFTSDEDTEAAS